MPTHTGQPGAPASLGPAPLGTGLPSRFLLQLGTCEIWVYLVFPVLGWRRASRQLRAVQVLSEGPPDLDLLDPKVRQERTPQSLVHERAQSHRKDSKSPLLPLASSPPPRGGEVSRCEAQAAAWPVQACPFCASRLQSLPGVCHEIMAPHMCVGSWAVVGRRASPALGCKEADEALPEGRRGLDCAQGFPRAAPAEARRAEWGRRSPRQAAGAGGPMLPALGTPSSALPATGDRGCRQARPPGADGGTWAAGAAGENFQPHCSVEMVTGTERGFCNLKTPNKSSVIPPLRKQNGRTRQSRLGPPARQASPGGVARQAPRRPQSSLAGWPSPPRAGGAAAAEDVTPLYSSGSKK